MTRETERKRGISLFPKTFLFFALSISVFAVVLGVIYLNLYQRATVEEYSSTMRKNAETIAVKCEKTFENGTGQKNIESWIAYWAQARDLMQNDIWPVSNPKVEKNLKSAGIGLDIESDLQSIKEGSLMRFDVSMAVIEVAGNVFKSNGAVVPAVKNEDKEEDTYVMTIGVPVHNSEGEVIGAIIVTSELPLRQKIVSDVERLIFVSGGVALIISLFLAFFFASMLTKPIAVLQKDALQMASGDYSVKTGIVDRNDEIGDLARAMDFLGDELAKTEKEREYMEQMRLDFFANVSHELRTPITVLRAYAESMLDGVVSEDKKEVYYTRMVNECQSMQRLVGDLLILSKMQNPEFEINKEPVNLVQIFDDIIRSGAEIVKKKGIKVVTENESDVIMILGDYDRIRQMFLVFFDNAHKFSKENSTIYITIKTEGDNAVASVRDEGVGIAKEDMENIFDKFYKSKLRQNATGSGLGLTIAKNIAIKHGGKIDVKSELGVGTEFVVTIPLIERGNMNF